MLFLFDVVRNKMKKLIVLHWCFYAVSLFGIPQQAKDYHLYFWAQYNQSLNTNHDVVDTCYEILFNNNQKDLAYPGYIAYLADTKRYKEIVSILPSIKKETFPEETQLLFAQALEAVGKKKEAEELLMQLVEKQPTKTDIVYYAASVYARNNDVKKALEIIDTYLDNTHDTSKNFLFYFFKAQLFAQVDNKESVENMLKKTIELNPNFEQAWLLLGVVYQEQGNQEKALELYQKAQQHLGTRIGIQRQLMALQAKQYFVNNQKQKTTFDQAVELFKQDKYKESLQAINQCLSYGSHEPSKVIKIELLCRLGNCKEALSWITEWIQDDPTQTKWFDVLETLNKAGLNKKDIEQTLVTVAQAKANYYLPNYYLGGWYINAHAYAQALTYLKKAFAITKDIKKQQQAALLMMLCYEHTKQWSKLYQFATQPLNEINKAITLLN